MFKYTVKKSETKQPYMWEVHEELNGNDDLMVLCQNQTNARTLAGLLTRIEAIDHKDKVRDDRGIDTKYQPRTLASTVALEIIKDLNKKQYSVDDIEAIADWIHYQADKEA